MKNFKKALGSKRLAQLAAVGAMGALAMANANATIDASVGTALTAIQADATSLSALVIPIVVAVMGLFIVIKLIKKFGGKIG